MKATNVFFGLRQWFRDERIRCFWVHGKNEGMWEGRLYWRWLDEGMR